jgi:dipeptidyl aminopeptidase/acylaminoacyl peptidase
MRLRGTFRFLLTGALALLLLSACGTSGDVAMATQTAIAATQSLIPLPTQLSGLQMQVDATQACVVQSYPVIHVQSAQGDLIAWSPVADTLAFVQPADQSWGWYGGRLMTYNVARRSSLLLSSDQEVYGDVTWSPDGNSLAYVVYDQENSLYTVRVVGKDGGSSTDIFGSTANARTDDWSSPKGITGWQSATLLNVTSSCGVDCSRAYAYDTASSQLQAQGEMRKSEDSSLESINAFTSPDTRWQIFVDADENIWLLDVVQKDAAVLLANTTLDEVKWAESSDYFALRAQNQVLIYAVDCPTN